MTDLPSPSDLAADLRDAFRPLWRQINRHRTLSLGKVGILSHLEQRGAMTATELASHERVSHQAVANAVRELEELEMVTRNADPDDRRRTLICLTDTGLRQLATERSAGQDWLARVLIEQFDDAERATLAAAVPLLRRLDVDVQP